MSVTYLMSQVKKKKKNFSEIQTVKHFPNQLTGCCILNVSLIMHCSSIINKYDFTFLKIFLSLLPKFSSVTQSCLTLCDRMNHSMPGLPVHHQLPESTQTHVHRVGGAIQPSHTLSSPSPPAINLSQHQGLFKQVNSSQ